jgi:hypothetical protein
LPGGDLRLETSQTLGIRNKRHLQTRFLIGSGCKAAAYQSIWRHRLPVYPSLEALGVIQSRTPAAPTLPMVTCSLSFRAKRS